MVKNKLQNKKNRKRKNDPRDCHDRKHYEEFGEAHPVDDRSNVKRLRVDDTEDNEESRLSDGSVSSEDEQEDTDAVSRLLATFKTNANSAVDSDDDDDNDDEEDSEEDDVASESDSGNDSDSNINGKNQLLEEDDDTDNSDSDAEVSVDTNSKVTLEKVSSKSDEVEDEDDAAQDEDDPFTKHFQFNLDTDTAEVIRKSECWTSSFEMWPFLKRIRIDKPKVEAKKAKPLLLACDDDDNVLPDIGVVPKPPSKKSYNLADLHVLQPLRENIPLIDNNESTCTSGFTEIQKELFAILSNYSDLYFPESTYEKYEEVKVVYAAHALNHALKTRKRILRHNSKIQKERTKKSKRGTQHCYRDQGYTRPKVLILLPFRHSAFRVIEIMSSLMQADNFEVLKQSRFREEYGPQENQDPLKKINRAEDFHEIFKGNSSEDFKIGVKVTRRTLKETAKIAKRRSDFFDGKKQFLLYTERFHFYRRYRIKGVRHIIFYDLPTYPHFFSEICNFMVAGNQNRRTQKRHIGKSTATVLYQQTDLTKLVGILGSQRSGEIIKANKTIHVCVLGT